MDNRDVQGTPVRRDPREIQEPRAYLVTKATEVHLVDRENRVPKGRTDQEVPPELWEKRETEELKEWRE